MCVKGNPEKEMEMAIKLVYHLKLRIRELNRSLTFWSLQLTAQQSLGVARSVSSSPPTLPSLSPPPLSLSVCLLFIICLSSVYLVSFFAYMCVCNYVI